MQFSFRLIHRFPSWSSLLFLLVTTLAVSEVGSSDALANLKHANLSVRFEARRAAGNDIGIGPVLAAGCPSVPEVVSEIAEVIASACERDSQRLR